MSAETMTSMIERVAREMHREWYECGRQIPPPFPTDRFEIERWHAVARAAIKAMREPTDMIIHAGDAESMRFRGEALQIWRGMIDAVLAEKS